MLNVNDKMICKRFCILVTHKSYSYVNGFYLTLKKKSLIVCIINCVFFSSVKLMDYDNVTIQIPILNSTYQGLRESIFIIRGLVF